MALHKKLYCMIPLRRSSKGDKTILWWKKIQTVGKALISVQFRPWGASAQGSYSVFLALPSQQLLNINTQQSRRDLYPGLSLWTMVIRMMVPRDVHILIPGITHVNMLMLHRKRGIRMANHLTLK